MYTTNVLYGIAKSCVGRNYIYRKSDHQHSKTRNLSVTGTVLKYTHITILSNSMMIRASKGHHSYYNNMNSLYAIMIMILRVDK